MRIAFLDHKDSFTYNVVALLQSIQAEAILQVFSVDASVQSVEAFEPDWIVIGPGPGRPQDYPLLQQCLSTFIQKKPILGVCLGMQAINEYCGGKTIRAPKPMHGKTSEVRHEGDKIFNNIPSPFLCMRYHSLQVQAASSLQVVAHADDGVPMAIRLKDFPVFGLQFHPESFASQFGKEVLQNILKEAFGA